MRRYFGYIRVSTTKQGDGASLPEQRDAIARFAARRGFTITQWFEEQKTAAKRGRPVFRRMLTLLRRKRADGVIIHKIDRSARNRHDWADLAELIDDDIEVHFANESLDLRSRGGRLTADIQAAVAVDFIQNLREESRKGFYGRLKQGLFPMRAPIGYVDTGRGKLKEPDPVRAPLVQRAFELYATSGYSLPLLLAELTRLGLRNKNGAPLSMTGLSTILNNPFYYGVIRIKKTGENFDGKHTPLIRHSLFARVQAILHGKAVRRTTVHAFVYRRLLRCSGCGYALIGERKKGHVYYRCHTPACRGTSMREEAVEHAVLDLLRPLCLSAREKSYIAGRLLPELASSWAGHRETALKSVTLCLKRNADRLNRLTDAYLDGAVDRESYENRKAALLGEKRDLEDRLATLGEDGAKVPDQVTRFLELAGGAYLRYSSFTDDEKRELIQIITSNFPVEKKRLLPTRRIAFEILAKRTLTLSGVPPRAIPRTWKRLLPKLVGLAEKGELSVPAALLEREDILVAA